MKEIVMRLLLLAVATVSSPAWAGSAGECPVARIAAGLDELSATGRMPADVRALLSDPATQRVPVFRAFDNVYFVGICWVSSWLIVDPAGDILIDTLHEPHVGTLLDNIAATGAKPDDIRYVLITHGHFDHAGGAARLKPALPKTRFVMTRRGWDEATESAASASPMPWSMIAPDIVAKDGDQIVVGNITVTVYETPGHTFGTASFAYRVRDGGTDYRAITVGGLGLNAIKSLAQVEAYVASVKRLQALMGDATSPIAVSLTTHPPGVGMFDQADRLTARKAGQLNPFVDAAGLGAQLARLLRNGEARVTVEKGEAGAR